MVPKMMEVTKIDGVLREVDDGEMVVISKDMYQELLSRSLAASDLMICGEDAIKERDQAREDMKKWLERLGEVEIERDLARGQLATCKQMLSKFRKAIARHKSMIHSGCDPYDANHTLWNSYNGRGE